MISASKITKAKNVKKLDPVYYSISKALSNIDVLNHVKIYNGRIKASNELSKDGKKEPITKNELETSTGVELLVDPSGKVIQFYSIVSSEKGSGEKIVLSVVNSTPKDWAIIVTMDWSGGFWEAMVQKYPRVVIF
ncbi:MAG: hypothetical protein KKF30_01195 [Proteobacteria bacterium]|nr:hypothetical protein [Pseudomonadota bacterium]MBU4470758.1 hypothetical protein [Pseudomonadota bacterium]MCG2751514.1 hypothetical protein [Desulfobacteraceae bacterium]